MVPTTLARKLIHPVRLGPFLAILLAPLAAFATTYHVAPNGIDTAAGTAATTPWLTIGRAQRTVVPGDTVLVHGGSYAFTGTTNTVGGSFTTSGTAALPINYFAAPGEAVPIFDLSGLTPQARVTGLDVQCNFVHIRGLEVLGVHQFMSGQDSWGVRIQGNNNVLENINSHNNDAPGFFITSGANNLILNCDSHNNYDFLEGGGSGDGFGCHSSGGGNVLRGCRSYDNSDDGYDFINAAGSCTVQNSFSFRNGFIPGTTTAAGNGAGFKAGGYGSPPVVPATGAATHTVENCVAFGNRAEGFYANHHPGRINFYNNTAVRNPQNFNMLADAGFPSSHVIRNNVAMTGTAITNLTGGTDTFNSWTLSVTVSAADFASVDETLALIPRAADGSLPTTTLFHLVAGSDLIDVGTDVGLPFVGSAPDLGAFEFGAVVVTGTGGATGVTGTGGTTGGTGGMTGAGGARTTGAGGSTATGAGGSVVTGGGGSTVTGAGGSVLTGTAGSTGTGGRSAGGSSGGSSGGSAAGSSGGEGGAPGGGEITGAAGGCTCAIAGTGGGTAGALLSSLLLTIALRARRRRHHRSAGGRA